MAEKTILIVDYDSKSLDSLVKLFELHKFKILKAMDGHSAYEMFKSKNPDLILLEAMLPKLHGFDLTQKVFQETKGRVPVVIVTGLYKGAQYRNEALRSFGAADYFEKPYNSKKLVDAVMNLLQDDIELDEELPDPNTVISNLTKMLKKRSSSSK